MKRGFPPRPGFLAVAAFIAAIILPAAHGQPAPTRVMAVGDSITEGGDYFASYRPLLGAGPLSCGSPRCCGSPRPGRRG